VEYRTLGGSGLKVSALSFGTATFGGTGAFFKAWGGTDAKHADRLIGIALDAGVNLIDCANSYSRGLAEQILGEGIGSRRDQLFLATKATLRMGTGVNELGSSRYHLIEACNASLERLRTDRIDLWQMHTFDASTPVEETLRALDDLVRAGKVRYIGCSNFSGWHLMKSLAISDRHGWSRYISQQADYCLIAREFEWELMPLGLDQRVGTLVWSPLGGGQLTGKVTHERPAPEGTRHAQLGSMGPESPREQLYAIVDALGSISRQIGRSIAQVALNWVLHRPTVSSVVLGARNEEQLRENLGATEFKLEKDHIAQLDHVSWRAPIYPYWHQWIGYADRNPPPVPVELPGFGA
jgi:aryl-alcohol dehydrogenase-like predicted oxidoreductase